MKMFCEKSTANTCPNIEVGRLNEEFEEEEKEKEDDDDKISVIVSVYFTYRFLYGRQTLIDPVMYL